MNLFDFHCDLPGALLHSGNTLWKSNGQFDLSRTAFFGRVTQVTAFFTPPAVPDAEGFDYVVRMAACLRENAKESNVCLSGEIKDIQSAWKNKKTVLIPSLEDARILAGNLSRIGILRQMGVRFAAPFWRGENRLGGAHDTDIGLSPFGHEALSLFLSSGILPDVSHASHRAFRDIEVLCKKNGAPMLATHSCAAALSAHTRNLTDAEIRAIAQSGGVVGLNLYPPFLSEKTTVQLPEILLQIRHLYKIGGKDLPALGCDFDGVDALPRGISSVGDLPLLIDALRSDGFTSDEIERLFFKNGERFLLENL